MTSSMGSEMVSWSDDFSVGEVPVLLLLLLLGSSFLVSLLLLLLLLLLLVMVLVVLVVVVVVWGSSVFMDGEDAGWEYSVSSCWMLGKGRVSEGVGGIMVLL